MYDFIGNHFPALVVVGMAFFMVVLGGVSIDDAIRNRSR